MHRRAKMNLTVHGLEGNIQKAISYYEDPHELVGKVNYEIPVRQAARETKKRKYAVNWLRPVTLTV